MIFLDYFDVLISKLIFKKLKKNIILIYFQIKKYFLKKANPILNSHVYVINPCNKSRIKIFLGLSPQTVRESWTLYQPSSH